MRAAYGSGTVRVTRECESCHAEFTATRPGHVVCSDRCRQRKHRAGSYVVTDADRAAIRRVFARDGYGCPLPPVSREAVLAHVLATAERT